MRNNIIDIIRENDPEYRPLPETIEKDPLFRFAESYIYADGYFGPFNARDILVLGAGGFTLSHDEPRNRYTYVDIDPAIRGLAEQHFLKDRARGEFIAEDARRFVTDTTRRFDAVVVDEWHELMGTKRGVLLELALARLRTLAPRMRTWGLSATLGNLEQARDVMGILQGYVGRQ